MCVWVSESVSLSPSLCVYVCVCMCVYVFMCACTTSTAQVDRRLASQQATGGTINQSKHEYTIFVVGFIDEKESAPYVDPFFTELLRIERTGELSDGTKINIKANQASDKKYTWQLCGRGHGSGSGGHFCCMCLVHGAIKHKGQPGLMFICLS